MFSVTENIVVKTICREVDIFYFWLFWPQELQGYTFPNTNAIHWGPQILLAGLNWGWSIQKGHTLCENLVSLWPYQKLAPSILRVKNQICQNMVPISSCVSRAQWFNEYSSKDTFSYYFPIRHEWPKLCHQLDE